MATRLEELVADIQATLNDRTVEQFVGRKHLAHHAPGRRVTWVRMPSPLEAPKHSAATLVSGEMVTLASMRVENVNAYVAAISDRAVAHDEATEALFETLIAAISLTCGPSAVCKAYDWISEGSKVAGETLRVSCIELQVQFRMPVLERIESTRICEGFATTYALDLDGDASPAPAPPPPIYFLTYNGVPLGYTP